MGKTILTAHQQNLLLAAKRDNVIVKTFYLTGGTALSHYYLKHRISEDFDFFSEKEFPHQTVQVWSKTTAKQTNADDLEYQTLNGQDIYYFHYPREVVKVDFAYYPFEHVGSYLLDEKLRVSSIADIGINKLHALTTRKRGRDFVDLYEIIHSGGTTMKELLAGYRLKFDLYLRPEEWAKHFIGILDATDQPRFLGKRTWKDVESYFTNEAKRLSSDLLTRIKPKT